MSQISLPQACDAVAEALCLDNADDLQGAKEKYREALTLLQQVSVPESDVSTKKTIASLILIYSDRLNDVEGGKAVLSVFDRSKRRSSNSSEGTSGGRGRSGGFGEGEGSPGGSSISKGPDDDNLRPKIESLSISPDKLGTVCWEDVVGLDEAKDKLSMFLALRRTPQLFVSFLLKFSIIVVITHAYIGGRNCKADTFIWSPRDWKNLFGYNPRK